MAANASQFVGNIPADYDAGLGPNIFVDYAADMARRAKALKPARVLELAAGTGIVSRALRDALPAHVPLVVTDLNAPMLEVARAKFRRGENIEFRTADAMTLDFPDGAFDLIACQFGVMFFPDKPASFREALRVLRPGGAYLFNTWGTMADNPFSRIANEIVTELFPANPPGFYRVPFSYADPPVVTADLAGAGFRDVTHEAVAVQKKVADVADFARGIVCGNPIVNEITERGMDTKDVTEKVERRFRQAFGPNLTMPLLAHVFSGRRP